jgi:hypothetical protein
MSTVEGTNTHGVSQRLNIKDFDAGQPLWANAVYILPTLLPQQLNWHSPYSPGIYLCIRWRKHSPRVERRSSLKVKWKSIPSPITDAIHRPEGGACDVGIFLSQSLFHRKYVIAYRATDLDRYVFRCPLHR